MNRQDISTFEEAEDYINGIPRFSVKNTMEDTRAFLRLLGNPDRKMHIIHVAGTNGKGSVCAYLCSILRKAGYRTALFTSPHLVDIRERFTVDGEMISREDFLESFLEVYGMLEENAPEGKGYHPSWFEYLFFMAMVYFGEKEPDFCILETGLGGRLDATNSVSRKELAVITHISLDHVEYLGDTVEKIACEKAGIMQAGAPAVYWDTCPETTAVFRQQASRLGISAHSVSENDYSFSKFNGKSIDFSLRTEYYGYINLVLRTIGAYQMENCTLAVRAIELLGDLFCKIGKKVTAEHIQKGVEDCFWAGRMEEVLPEVYVDGAHNEDGIRAFLETVAGDGYKGPRTLLFSVVKDKDYEHMTKRLAGSGLFSRIAVAHMGSERGLAGEKLQKLFEGYPGCGIEVYGNVEDAFYNVLKECGRGMSGADARESGSCEEDTGGREIRGESICREENCNCGITGRGRIYIAGSLYLAGEIKELICDDKFRRRIKEIPPQS